MSKPNTEQTIWSRVEKTQDCWIWTGSLTRFGYGAVKFKGKHYPAHRLIWLLTGHDLQDDLTLDHLCRVKNCVNPAHLEMVTLRENILRSNGVSALNAKKTHCLRGHPLSGDNIKISKKGQRVCQACVPINWQEWRRKQSA